jgi:hypothetical protein
MTGEGEEQRPRMTGEKILKQKKGNQVVTFWGGSLFHREVEGVFTVFINVIPGDASLLWGELQIKTGFPPLPICFLNFLFESFVSFGTVVFAKQPF